jgi:hypothetical protein
MWTIDPVFCFAMGQLTCQAILKPSRLTGTYGTSSSEPIFVLVLP